MVGENILEAFLAVPTVVGEIILEVFLAVHTVVEENILEVCLAVRTVVWGNILDVRILEKMANHFLRNPYKRPRICSNHNPTPKNLLTFVRIP